MKYRNSVYTLIVIFLAACSDGNNMTRSDAKKLIDSTPIKSKIAVPLNKDFMNCLLNSKQVRQGFGGFSPFGRAEQYIVMADYGIFLGRGVISLTQPIHFKNVEVTGITEARAQSNQSQRQVDFTADYDFRSIAIDGVVPQCFADRWIVAVKGSLTKYDDGWRIAYTNIELQNELKK